MQLFLPLTFVTDTQFSLLTTKPDLILQQWRMAVERIAEKLTSIKHFWHYRPSHTWNEKEELPLSTPFETHRVFLFRVD